MIEGDGARGIARDHGEARVEAFDEPAEEGGDAARDLSLAPLAVGEAGAVGGVYDRRVGKELEGRRQHRQSADPGIEEENGGVGVHWLVIARSEATKQSSARLGLLRFARNDGSLHGKRSEERRVGKECRYGR